MNTTDYIGIAGVVMQLIVAGVAIWAVLASLRANKRQIEAGEKQLKKQIDASDLQLRRQIEESRRLATEEQQHQSRPIIVPIRQFTTYPGRRVPGIYIDNKTVNWNYQGTINLELQNMGGGVALNIHCILYGSGPMHTDQFVSWDNGPIGKNPVDVLFEHPKQLHLAPDDLIDGVHPLYDTSPTSPSNPTDYRIAGLTITYHDLFGTKHLSVFNYTLEHRWICVTVGKIPSLNGKPPLDLKELDDQKRQQAPKWSAPQIITSQ